ncbi:MAG TPA: helix-turn-helix transcriptional regulator, partial [Candidatus Dormibacteraeota bacterium]
MGSGGPARQRAFSDLLRAHRESAGLSQEVLAARSGLSVDAIGLLERGRRQSPRASTLTLLADALDLDPAARARFFAAARPGAGPGRRRPRVLIAAAALAVALTAAGGVLALVAGPWARGARPLQVGGVQARLDGQGPGCGVVNVALSGIVRVAGGSGTLTYHWVRPDGRAGRDASVAVVEGTRSVPLALELAYPPGGAPVGEARLVVTSPRRMASAPVAIGGDCPAAPPGPATPVAT